MPNFFVDSNKQKAANEALARGEKDYMQTGLRAPASILPLQEVEKKQVIENLDPLDILWQD